MPTSKRLVIRLLIHLPKRTQNLLLVLRTTRITTAVLVPVTPRTVPVVPGRWLRPFISIGRWLRPTHRILITGTAPEGFPVITLIGDNPMPVALNTSFTDPGATAEDAEDGSVTVTADCSSVDTSAVGTYSCLYTATDSDTNVTTTERQVEVTDPNAPTETCEQATASPSAHISAGRAYAGGNYSLRALANGDDYLGAIPGGYAWVREISEGVFEKGQCQ